MHGTVVQWLEHRPVTAEVAGSSPVIPEYTFFSLHSKTSCLIKKNMVFFFIELCSSFYI